MPSSLPPGDPAPADGSLPGARSRSSARRPFGFYVHVPFCTVRCGYCDFNTYTAAELGDQPGASRATYAEAAIAEIRLARRVLGDRGPARSTRSSSAAVRRPCCAPGDLAPVLAAIAARVRARRRRRGDHRGQPRQRRRLATSRRCARRGFTRVSFGMQSAVAARAARPSTAPTTRCGCRPVVDWARAAGFEQVSLDLIYGTPGESLGGLGDLARGRAGVRARPRLGVLPDRRGRAPRWPGGSRRGELPMPDDDDLADKYLLADERLGRGRARAGTRCPTGRATRDAGAGTTELYWTGGRLVGRRARARTATSAACGGGTSSTPRRTPAGWPTGVSPAARARDARRRDPAGRAGAARDPAARRAAGAARSTPHGRAAVAGPGRARAGRAGAPSGWCSPGRAGCSPTPSCATCCPDRSAAGRPAGGRLSISRSTATGGRTLQCSWCSRA